MPWEVNPMSKVLMVAQREVLENIKTKGFWIGIFIFPLVLTLSIFVPSLLEKAKEVRDYAVIDQSGWVLEEVERSVARKDLAIVFGEVAIRARAEDKGAEVIIPDALRTVAPELAALDQHLIPEAASMVVDTAAGKLAGSDIESSSEEVTLDKQEPGSSLSSQLKSLLRQESASILAWWNNISPKEAGGLSKRVSKAKYRRVVPAEGKNNPEALKKMVSEETLFAYFVIGADPVEGKEGSRYISKNITDDDLVKWFRAEVVNLVRERRMKQKNIDPETANWLMRSFRFESLMIGETGAEEKVKLTDKITRFAPVAFVYLLWIAIMSVSQMLLTNTVEEKSNRIIEVLLSSVSPVQLMAGKILGIAGTGLAVVVSWMVTFFFVTKYLPGMMGANLGFDLSIIGTNPIYLFSFIMYFILGYLFYAAILVAIGSVCNTLKEAQNLMAPVMIIMIIPLLAMVPIAKDPDSLLAKILSYIPPFTPYVMMNRAATEPPLIEYLITTGLLVASILFALWVAAKVFRIGILLTGKAPGVGEIMKWIKAPVGSFPERKKEVK
jgi:ABC-2 type transport system permease protein